MNLAKYSLDNSKVIYFFLAVLLFGGIFSFDNLGKKEDAPFVIKQAMVFAQYPGATAAEMEELVTEVIERELQTMPNIYRIISDSYNGSAKISIELQPYTPPEDIPQMWDVLRRKILNVQPMLPQGTYVMVNDDFGDVFGIYYALVAEDGYSYQELRDWSQEIKRQISTVDGVQQVMLFGEQNPIINVYISLAKLANLGVDPTNIIQIISAQNKLVSPGNRLAGDMEIKIFADGTYKTIEDIQNQIITTSSNQQIRLGDIAQVEKGYTDPPSTIMKVNGKRAIGIAISSPKDKDVVKTGENVSKVLESMITDMPIGLELTYIYSEDVIAREANNGFVVNLIESVLIVIIILMFVMGFKASILIGSSLLFSISGTMLIMEIMGVGLNRTSLAGFIIAMGMLVDNAIVVTDNAQVSMKRGISKRKAIIDGATGPQWGLLGATLIAIFSFLPLYLAQQAVAEIVQPLFVVIGVSLGLSWILALTQTTSFAALMFKEDKDAQPIDPYDKKFYHKFEAFILLLIRNKWKTILTAVGAFFLAIFVMGIMPQNFFPALDKEYFRADCIFPNGYNINDVDKEMTKVEEWLLEQPAVKKVSITMGATPPRYYLASASFGPMPNYSNVLVELKDKDSTVVLEERFNRYIRNNYPNVIIKSTLFKVSPQPEGTIELGFSGEDIDTLVMLTKQVEQIMRDCPLVDQVRNSWGSKVPVLKPSYSQEKGQRTGVSRMTMAQNLAIATNGFSLGDFIQKDQFLPIMLKDVNNNNFNLSDLKTIPVFTPYGNVVPISQITDDFKYEYDYYDIKRFNRKRYMLAQAEPRRGANTEEAFKAIHAQIKETVNIPNGYELLIRGEQESKDLSNQALADKMPLTFILIFITLLLLFRAYKKPMVILAMIPLIFIGVVLGLVVLGKMFDFFCMLGVLGLIGMNIKNAIVLVDQIDIERSAGRSPLQSVVQATKSRIVPVAMASGTTILGMFPLLFDAMFGGMAATIMGGLLVATFLTILVLPVTYCIAFKIHAPKETDDEE